MIEVKIIPPPVQPKPKGRICIDMDYEEAEALITVQQGVEGPEGVSGRLTIMQCGPWQKSQAELRDKLREIGYAIRAKFDEHPIS